jgi:secreted PhoX family phosphatase
VALIPLNLLVSHDGRSKRQHITCRFRCGDACSKPVPNRSDNEYFGDIVREMSRRSLLRATGVAVLAVGAGSVLAACGDAESPAAVPPPSSPQPQAPQGMRFTPVAPNTEDAVVVPDGYQNDVVIAWGDPILEGAPPFDVTNQTGAAQRGQFGFNNDFAGLLPIPGRPDRFLLVTNFEYVTPQFMFPGYDPENPTREQFEVEIAAVGMGVVEVERSARGLSPVIGPYNRRITADTPFTLTGPAAGSDLVTTAADPAGRTVAGTFANCSGGITPWGTVLSGEENWNSYFGAPDGAVPPNPVVADRYTRYGIATEPSELRWETFDPRFDLTANPNEVNRFGYVVELNPWDPSSTPVKHSALGRLKHEAATIHVTDDGTVVAYTGDDERFDYMYKFVSAKRIRPGGPSDPAAMAHNMTLLDEGTLYVARLSSDIPAAELDGSGRVPSGGFRGTGTWIPLLRSGPDGQAESLVDGFTAAQVAVFTRMAADKVGATKMDRPEDFEANPRTGKVYVALTNNDERGAPGEAPVDAANPRNDNKSGQVLELTDDHAGTEFTWELLLVCGDPAAADTYFAGFDKSKVSPISCPDNLAFDSHGNLWISTDGNALDSNDGLFAVALEGANRGETRQFLTVPVGAETCGPVVTDDLVTVCVQHPGEHDDHTVDNPLSRWPDDGTGVARPAVVAVWKTDGNIGT